MPRGKPHFKVRLSVKNHDDLPAVYSSNDLFALWVRLGMAAIERFADRTGDRFIVPDRELMMLTGKGRLDVARTSLSRLADVSPISAERDGDVWRIHFPNLAQKQGFRPRNGTVTGPPATATATATPEKLDPTECIPDPDERGQGPTPPKPTPGPVEPAKPKPDYPDIVGELCGRFLKARALSWPDLAEPTAAERWRWAKEMDRLLRLGPPGGKAGKNGADPEHVARVIVWLYDPGNETKDAIFWRKNVRSIPTLRKQWEALTTAITTEGKPHGRTGKPSSGDVVGDIMRARKRRTDRARKRGGDAG